MTGSNYDPTQIAVTTVSNAKAISANGFSIGINRQYKDRLFKFLFGNPEHRDWTLALYNAVNGTSYVNPGDITFTTIQDAVYMDMKNDVSLLNINSGKNQALMAACPPLREYSELVENVRHAQKTLKI